MTSQFATTHWLRPLSQTTLSVGLGLLASFMPAIARADIAITGGRASFNDSVIFVPDSGTSSAVVFQNPDPTSILIRTTQGDIPLNAIFRTSTLPQLDTCQCAAPAVGDTGSVLGTLTFRGFTASGQPGLYSGIPTSLDFTISSGTFTDAGTFTRYQTDPRLLIETGTIVTPISFTTVTRETPVVIVQFQPNGTAPTTSTVLNETFTPADFTATTDGTAFKGNFEVNLTGGTVSIPDPPGFQADATVTQTPEESGEQTGFGTPLVYSSTIFTVLPSNVPDGSIAGTGQTTPVMPQTFTLVGVFVFNIVPSGLWFDPPTAEAFDFTMKPSPQRVGVASRVFPGMGGTREETSLFTKISGLPKGIDKDDTFTVSVQGVTLGEFTADQTVNFRDYKDKLGSLLKDGQGVEAFTVSGINPSVDPKNPRAFPIRLDFSTPTASFEMKAQGVQTAAGQTTPIARLARTPVGQ